jgi:general secretion pathway protein E/type IV pilus assembly protein PilB
MDRQRMGELLARLGQLTPHDIDEILAEQRHTRQRFGAIAVSLGFCQPEHVWSAWCSQLNGRVEPVNLNSIGIDAQAVEFLPRELALNLRAMPVRVWEGQLVIAVADVSRAACVAELARRVGMDVKCVLAPHEQVESALATYYPLVHTSN